MKKVVILLILMMTGVEATDYHIQRISTGPKPAMHAYMDICPEDPSGKHVLYFEFSHKKRKKKKAPGRLVVINRTTSKKTYVSPKIYAGYHNAVKQRWLDKNTIAYQKRGKNTSIIYSLTKRKKNYIEGYIEDYYHPDRMLYLKKIDRDKKRIFLQYSLQTQQIKTLITDAQAIKHIPDCVRDPFCSKKGHLKNIRVSPDGNTIFLSFRAKRRIHGKKKKIKVFFFLTGKDHKINYQGKLGQHPLWYNAEKIHYYLRQPEIDFRIDPRAQHVVSHAVNGRQKRILTNALGIHGSFHMNEKYFITDIFHWPKRNSVSLLLYKIRDHSFEKIYSYQMLKGKKKYRVHPHPAWCHKSNRIYFNSSKSGQRQLYAIDFK